MADHLKPTVTSTYSNFVSELDARFDDLAVGLDPAVTSATNVPTNSQRWSSASNKWQKYNGTSWGDLAAIYSISISGNAGTVTNGIYTSGSYANPSWITSLSGSKITGDIAGNSGTTTKLLTARNINGVAFDGTVAISVNTNNSVLFNNTGTGAASGSAFNGGSAITVSYNTIGSPSATGANASGTWGINITGNAGTVTNGVYNNGGSYNINAATVTDGVYTTGDQTIGGNKTFSNSIVSNGDVTAYSDERLKTNWRNLDDEFIYKLANVKFGVYDRVDISKTQAGSSAQDWQKLLPQVVSVDKDGILSMAYGNAALLTAMKLAEKVIQLEQRLKELENKNID